MTDDPPLTPEQRRETLHRWLDDFAAERDLPTLLAEVRKAQEMLLRECADRIRGPINEHLAKNIPHQTIGEKKALCGWLNRCLDAAHLGVMDAVTGEVGILVAHPGKDSWSGRFQIRVTTPDGKRETRRSSVNLPSLVFGPKQSRPLDHRRLPRAR